PARLRRAPGFNDPLRRNPSAAMGVGRQRVARALRAGAAADEVAQLVELRANLAAVDLACALARRHVEKQALGHLRARAGEAGERDRAMAVLEGKLDRPPERIAVLRAMAVSAQPARRCLLECRQEFGGTEAVKGLVRLVVRAPARQHHALVRTV